MKKLLIIILTAISFQATSQDFAPIGAKWHYDQITILGLISYTNIECISDTLIDGKSCKKMISVSRFYGVPATSLLFMYSSNDSVFFYKGNRFHLLYDFGAVAGDTITLGYYTTYNGLPLKMVIDSLGIIEINNETRTVQYVTCGDGLIIEFGGIVIDGIGNLNYMFPSFDNAVEGPLRCYKEPGLGLFINPYHFSNGWNFEDCEQIIVGVPETKMESDIMILPNPATKFLEIINLDRPTEFTFFNIQGKFIKSGIITPSQLINLNDLSCGLYFLTLQNSKLLTTRKFIKK